MFNIASTFWSTTFMVWLPSKVHHVHDRVSHLHWAPGYRRLIGEKTVMSTFIPILASTATPFQIQKTTELERFLTNLVLFFKKTCKSRNWVGGLFLQQLCQSSAEGNWHKIQSWGVREKVFNRYSPWFDRESSENLLRPRSRAAVPDWPSRVLQLSFSSSCLKVSTTLGLYTRARLICASLGNFKV